MGLLDRAISFTLPAVPKPLVRVFSRRYIAGSRMSEAFDVVREMTRQGAMTTIDILGEFTTTPAEAVEHTRAYDELARRIHVERLSDTNISVKLTALGLLLDEQQCLENLRRLMQRIEKTDNFVRIDMEDSGCTTATLRIYRTLAREYPGRVGAVLQSRLRRSLDDVEELGSGGGNYRLCKGIYLEPREVAYTDAEIIRRNFVLLLDRMLELGAYVGIATHDEMLIWEALRLLRKHRVERERYEFQMLLGVTETLRRTLIGSGHRLRVYVPYGQHWYAYSVRRLRENPQIAGYAFRAMFRKD